MSGWYSRQYSTVKKLNRKLRREQQQWQVTTKSFSTRWSRLEVFNRCYKTISCIRFKNRLFISKSISLDDLVLPLSLIIGLSSIWSILSSLLVPLHTSKHPRLYSTIFFYNGSYLNFHCNDCISNPIMSCVTTHLI